MLVVSQGASLTPLSASSTDKQIEYQNRVYATDLLDITAANGELKTALLAYNPATDAFQDSPLGQQGYTVPQDNTEFGSKLNTVFMDRQTAVNIDLQWTEDEEVERVAYIDMGTPSDNSITVVKTITLFSSDIITYEQEGDTQTVTLREVSENDNGLSYVVPRRDDSARIYRTIQVRMTIWRV